MLDTIKKNSDEHLFLRTLVHYQLKTEELVKAGLYLPLNFLPPLTGNLLNFVIN